MRACSFFPVRNAFLFAAVLWIAWGVPGAMAEAVAADEEIKPAVEVAHDDNSLLKKGDRHLGPGCFWRVLSCSSETVPVFQQAVKGTEGTRPLSPAESVGAIRTKPGFTVELVAAEPLVIDPVAIDFGPDGRLWVAEMHDYPAGLDGNFSPGGRIKVLEDADGDGRYDRGTVFLDGLPFPTGVSVWRRGVLVCAAPDILYAEDTDGDGKADVVRKLFQGFATHNYQARVNGLRFGLDNWVYAATGIFGGKIKSFSGAEVDLISRDFRLNPDTGALEPATGQTQQGRVRDDWGNWFGCDNSRLIRHYPLVDQYVRRNPHVAPPSPVVEIPAGPDPNRLFPVSTPLERFNQPDQLNRVTSACGLEIYRDELLGPQCAGNAFVCEPVHNLVHRRVLEPRGVTFSAVRAADEASSEFLASTDNWFRPVQVRTGPDGALWVVDMYRFVIEHPRWISPERLARLDVRAGDRMGRIYRVVPSGGQPRPIARLDRLDRDKLAAALDTPNGTQRDLVHQMLLWKNDASSAGVLAKLATTSRRPQTRLHALCVLDGLHALTAETVLTALGDEHPGVRRNALRLAEPFAQKSPQLVDRIFSLEKDEDPQVQYQLASSLGQIHDPRSGAILARMGLRHQKDVYQTAAVLSSLNRENIADVSREVTKSGPGDASQGNFLASLFGLAPVLGDDRLVHRTIETIAAPHNEQYATWQVAALANLLDALDRRKQNLRDLLDKPQRERIDKLFTQARNTVEREDGGDASRIAAVRLLGRQTEKEADIKILAACLSPKNSVQLQLAVVAALGRLDHPLVADELLARWSSYTPRLRSQALDALLSRDAWLRRLLNAVHDGEVAAAEIDATRRQQLLLHKDESLRKLAATLLAGTAGTNRQKFIDDFRPALAMTGVSERGKQSFQKRCSVCHVLEGVGYTVGPDLAALTDRSPQGLLVEIFDPNRGVDERYRVYVAVTNDGRSFNGILINETATSITLKGQEGNEQVILRGDLDELHGTGKSLMPEGLEQDVSLQEVADLLAYLGGFGVSRKKLPGNQPAPATPTADSPRCQAPLGNAAD